jgi:hypothetical protein
MKQVVGDAGRGDDCPGTMCRCANPAHCAVAVEFKEWDCRLATIQSEALAEGGLFDLISASKPTQLLFLGVARQSVALARILSDLPEQGGAAADRANFEPVARLFETRWASVTTPA